MLQQTLKGMQEQLIQSKKQQVQDEQRIRELSIKLNAVSKKEEILDNEIITLDKDDEIVAKELTDGRNIQVSQKDAKLIGKYKYLVF